MKRALEAIIFLAVVGMSAVMATRFIARRNAARSAPLSPSYQGDDVEPGSTSPPRALAPNEHSVGGFPGSDSDSPFGRRPGPVPAP